MPEKGESERVQPEAGEKRPNFITPPRVEAPRPREGLIPRNKEGAVPRELSSVEERGPHIQESQGRPEEESTKQESSLLEREASRRSRGVAGRGNQSSRLLDRLVLNRLRFPSSTDGNVVQEKITIPATMMAAASSFGFTLLPVIEPFRNFAAGNPEWAIVAILGSTVVCTSSLLAMIGSFRLVDRLKKTEEQNRIPLSKLLTVSRVFTTQDSSVAPVVAKVDPSFKEGFTGELHFVGSSRESWEGLTTPLATLRDGAKGLYNLATACEQEDTNLDSISVFYGASPMLNQQFEEFGFQISGRGSLKKRSLIFRVAEAMAMTREPLTTTYPNGVKVNNHRFAVGLISRKELIRQKNRYARYMK